nr:RecName: Full=Sperm-specific protein PL-I; Short=PL-I; AltName: Full=Sperm-specific linker histone H1-like protein [Spisula solidissima]
KGSSGMMSMVAAAIAANRTKKGASAQAIRKYVAAHSSLKGAVLNFRLRRALAAGLKSGALAHPKGSAGWVLVPKK